MKRALLIGINYFGSSCELHGCVNDIDDVRKYLESECGFSQFTILKESDMSQHLTAVASCEAKQPTKENIMTAIREVVKSTVGGDMLYVHYSGHGSHIADNNGDERDGEDECICPLDYLTAGFILDDELRAELVDKLAPGAKLRVVFDSCHSGSALDLSVRWGGGDVWIHEKSPSLLPVALNQSVIVTRHKKQNSTDVVFISGCKDIQTSCDSQFDGRNNGALTWALIKSLRSFRKGNKSTNNTQHDWKDLVDSIRLKLKKEGYDQVPQFSSETRKQLHSLVDI